MKNIKSDNFVYNDGSRFVAAPGNMLFNGSKIGWHQFDGQWEFFRDGYRVAWLAKHRDLSNYYWVCVCDSLKYMVPDSNSAKELTHAKRYIESLVNKHFSRQG